MSSNESASGQPRSSELAVNAPAVPMSASRGFVNWLISQDLAIAFSTYQTGKLFLIGHNERGELAGYERNFERAMGLAGDGQTIHMATLYQLWRLENSLQPGETLEGYDRNYVPQVGHTTGDLNVHDVALVANGKPQFISARFSCLATISDRYHFKPLWMPKFITKLAGEDRCHLNGLAIVDGTALYVTACAETDVVDGWRDHRIAGGVVIDIESDQVVAAGLSMPHSPRWYQNKLWLLNSGHGQFGYVDLASGKFESVAFCPGFARGMAFVGNYAIVGLSLSRHDLTFAGLPLHEHLAAAKVNARCGLLVIDLTSGDAVEWLRLEEPVRELYDVLALPGVRRPRLVGFANDEIRTRVWADKN